MKQDKIIDALNDVDPEYIDEAAPKVKTRSRLRPWLAMAACLALTVGIFAAVRLVKPPSKPEPAPEGPSPHEIQDEGPKAGQDETIWPEPNADADTILGYRFGPLYLGMPFDDVKALYGEPLNPAFEAHVLEDGIARAYVSYKLSEDSEQYSDLGLDVADAGDGWVVNSIYLSTDRDFELPHGVKIGMTDAELHAVWPEITEEAAYNADAGFGEENGIEFTCASYSQFNGHLGFTINLQNGVVDSVDLGRYYEEPPWEMDTPAPEEPYSFFSGEITVWRRMEEGWQSVRPPEGRETKQIEMQFFIEELVPLEQDLSEIRYVVDFHNDTVCLVCAPEEGITDGPNTPPDAWGAVYHLEDRDAFESSLAAGEAVPQGLTRLETCIFPYGTWDTLNEAFE